MQQIQSRQGLLGNRASAPQRTAGSVTKPWTGHSVKSAAQEGGEHGETSGFHEPGHCGTSRAVKGVP